MPLPDFLAFCDTFGVALYDWQREAFSEACRRADGQFVHRLAGISVPRGNGKSYCGAAVGLWRLMCAKPPADLLSVALDREGAQVLLAHAKTIIRGNAKLSRAIESRAGSLLVPSTGSRWTIASAEHTSTRGRHPDLVIYDECGWATDDELFSSLLAGQASVTDPLMLVVSTVGRRQSGPLWTVKTLSEGGDESVFWWWSGENLSPKVTEAFLMRQRRILVPAQFAREHQNQWIDAADAFVSVEHVDAAMRHPWYEQHEGRGGVSYVVYVDIGLTHDPSVIAVGHEEQGTIFLDRLLTFQGSKRSPVQIETLEDALLSLSQQFGLSRIRVESWQGVSSVQRLQRIGLPVELVTPTPKLLADEWPMLAQAFAAGRLVLFPHARLREELLGLTVEVGAAGARIIDRGRAHQDHAVALRGVVAALGVSAEGHVDGRNLSGESVRAALGAETGDLMDEYRREQMQWEREAFWRELKGL